MTNLNAGDGCTTLIDLPKTEQEANDYVGANCEAELYEMLADLLKEATPHPRVLEAQEYINQMNDWYNSKLYKVSDECHPEQVEIMEDYLSAKVKEGCPKAIEALAEITALERIVEDVDIKEQEIKALN
jgi:hypothetical protein